MAARQVVRGTIFDLHFRENGAGESARLGFIVPKRLARAAVLRNSIKRQGREVFRLLADRIPLYDLVLRLARPVARTRVDLHVQRRIWRTEVEALFSRLPRQY